MAKLSKVERRLAVLEEACVNAFGGDSLRAKLAGAESDDEDGDGDGKGDD